MKKPKRIKIAVRAAEIADYQALARLFTHRNAYSQTLQLPFPSPERCRQRLAEQSDGHHIC
jgi:hypothetical protein